MDKEIINELFRELMEDILNERIKVKNPVNGEMYEIKAMRMLKISLILSKLKGCRLINADYIDKTHGYVKIDISDDMVPKIEELFAYLCRVDDDTFDRIDQILNDEGIDKALEYVKSL